LKLFNDRAFGFFTGSSKVLKRSKFAGNDEQENTSHDEAAGLISEVPALTMFFYPLIPIRRDRKGID
jgi:hypothetical protein